MTPRVICVGYYWPTLRENCAQYVKTYKECQELNNGHHTPPKALYNITSPWHFVVQGTNILKPFPTTKCQIKFLLVAVDYSTKWIKVELFATIIAQKVQKFTWKNIICRYDLPQAIVIDNERQFIEKDYEEFLMPLGIRHLTSSVEHPQTNGQVEAANKVILSELRKRLSKVPKGLWVDEPPSILWGYHCTPHSTTQKTPFRLTYGTKAMIHVEISEPLLGRRMFNVGNNSKSLSVELDITEDV